MKIICWNCHGLGNPQSVNALYVMVRAQDPNVLFLSEMKLRRGFIEAIRRRLDYLNVLEVERDELKGGLAMFWTAKVNLRIKSFSSGHIDLIITSATSSGGLLAFTEIMRYVCINLPGNYWKF